MNRFMICDSRMKNLVYASFVALFIILNSIFFIPAALAGNLSAKVEAPKTPTNLNSFNLNFVTLDVEGRAITAQCFKKGPSEGGFTQFGSDIAITAGGNSGDCVVTSSVISTEGIYSFFVKVSAGSDVVDSSIVSVEYKNSNPGAPHNYNKEKISSCVYRIKFKTDNDSGKTTKVELYRSDSLSFSADSGSRVDTVGIGSDQQGQFENGIPDCNKTYYYAIRAFDSAGNGSGIVGDEVVKNVNTTVIVGTTVTPASGAIPASGSTVGTTSGNQSGSGEVLGKESEEASRNGESNVFGASNASNEPTAGLTGSFFSSKKNLIFAVILAGLLFLVYRSRRVKKS